MTVLGILAVTACDSCGLPRVGAISMEQAGVETGRAPDVVKAARAAQAALACRCQHWPDDDEIIEAIGRLKEACHDG